MHPSTFDIAPRADAPAAHPAPRTTWTVRQKLVILMAMLVAGIALLMYLFFPAQLEKQAVETLAAKAATVAEMSVYTLAPALDFGNVDEVDEALAAALQFEDVQYAYVQAANGALVGSFVRDSLLAMPLVSAEMGDGITADGSVYHLHRPVQWREQHLGYLYMGFSLDALKQSVNRSRMMVAVLSLLVFLVGIGAAFGIGVFLTRPLGMMVKTADAIARGDLAARAAVTSNDEMGRLAASFNAMVDSLDVTYQALQGSEARFRAVIENTTDVIMLLDARGRFYYVSPSARDVLGYDPDEFIGRAALGFVHPDDRIFIKEGFLAGVRRRGETLDAEARFQHHDGSWRFFSYRGRNMLDHAGVEGLLISARDITARKQEELELMEAKETAEEMVRLKDAFLANMSHEIRTPITGILGAAQILGMEIGAEMREWVEVIELSGNRLMDTLNSVLDLAQLEAGGVSIHEERLDLCAEAREAVRLLAPLAHDGVVLVAEVPEVPACALLDRSGFQRIVNNLAGNALKFTDSGQVTLAVDADDETVRLHVRDTGHGISQEFLPRLFDEFHQESTGLNRSHEGNGLGLAITRKLVELMEGTIAVDSIKGVGTVFTVTFPRLHTDAPCSMGDTLPPVGVVLPGEVPIPSAPSARSHRVLLVEDNRETGMIAAHLLGEHFEIAHARNAEEALAHARAADYHAVLMDINLGQGRDGVAVMQDLRQMPSYQSVPIIALTAYAMPEDDRRFRDAGFDDYVSKPFERDELIERIHLHRQRGPTTREGHRATARLALLGVAVRCG